MVRPAEVRFYFDADILGLAKVIAALRPDCTYPGDRGAVIHKHERPPCPIESTGVLDTVWLPQVAHQGWLILTRDFNIRRTPAELQAVRTNAARMVALSGDLAGTKWGQLQLLMMRWDRIEELASEPGPFIVLASRAGLRSVDLAA